MIQDFIGSHFKKPEGWLGQVISNMMVRKNEINYRKIISDLHLSPHHKILEIGYGPGEGIKMITDQCPTCTVHGIDFSKLMFEKASLRNEHAIAEGKVKLIKGDFLKMQITESDFDRIFCINVIYFWDDLALPFQKVYSLLKEQATFHIYMADPEVMKRKHAPENIFKRRSVEEVKDSLLSTNFSKVRYDVMHEGYYITAEK